MFYNDKKSNLRMFILNQYIYIINNQDLVFKMHPIICLVISSKNYCWSWIAIINDDEVIKLNSSLLLNKGGNLPLGSSMGTKTDRLLLYRGYFVYTIKQWF